MVGISKVLIVANKRNNNNNPIKSKFIAVFSKPDSIHPVCININTSMHNCQARALKGKNHIVTQLCI